jgi:hypothetical protein
MRQLVFGFGYFIIQQSIIRISIILDKLELMMDDRCHKGGFKD